MPKEKRSRSISLNRPSPFPSTNPPTLNFQQYDEIRCPVCMDHPHNAVLLLCSSHDKGCLPFICDTSYRHSNCLDQYRKAIKASFPDDDNPSDPILSCPLCRGLVSGSKVLQPVRQHMNSKPRSCSTESCGFFGSYSELRKHARTDHPLVRPSDADPERERDWRTLERERDFGDLISTMQSGFGDEDGDGLVPFSTITFFLVLRFRGSGGISGSSVGWSNGRRSRSWRRGRVLWGESIVEAEVDGRDRIGDDDVDGDYVEDGDDDDDDGGEEVDGRRQRRARQQLRMLDDIVDGDDVIM